MITPEQEREKYRRMWTEVKGYRDTSPGERLVEMFLGWASWKPGQSLIDAGCGPGRAALRLNAAGLNVTLFDITRQAPDPDARSLPFIEGCLWRAEDIESTWPGYDWVYCCDVMEHIPPEHVDAALDNLQDMTCRGAFFQIALFSEGWGSKIGETLHLTVESAEWWKERIEKRWQGVEYKRSGDNRLLALTGAPL